MNACMYARRLRDAFNAFEDAAQRVGAIGAPRDRASLRAYHRTQVRLMQLRDDLAGDRRIDNHTAIRIHSAALTTSRYGRRLGVKGILAIDSIAFVSMLEVRRRADEQSNELRAVGGVK
jgi:hypothetical protein